MDLNMVKGPAIAMTFPSSLYHYVAEDETETHFYECPQKGCTFFLSVPYTVSLDIPDEQMIKFNTEINITLLSHLEDVHQLTILESGSRSKYRNYVW